MEIRLRNSETIAIFRAGEYRNGEGVARANWKLEAPHGQLEA